MAQVFFIERPRKQGLDMSTAEQFGRVRFVFDYGDRRCSAFRTREFMDAVVDKLSSMGYVPGVDFMCLTGSIIVVALSLVALTEKFNVTNILMYNAIESDYVMRKIETGDSNARTPASGLSKDNKVA